MTVCEDNIIKARSLLFKSLAPRISSDVINLEGCFFKLVFTNGTILYLTYNNFSEYSYQYIYSYKQFDRERFDNYDKNWNVTTHPHHFHPRGVKEGKESPMTGEVDHDLPLLVDFLLKRLNKRR
ncbi:MAG: DUF6516 family protein [Candidatus Hermodarchaeota archaeon]